ncbi:MAG: hypothetical protein OFPII_28380 [Osedax symbiont Rs1]|nr:MAG: hypothetical protein OFPII_28380 [Osedax symbiont Rs1]
MDVDGFIHSQSATLGNEHDYKSLIACFWGGDAALADAAY